jgi:osmotically-inducible protein OsmY
MFPVQIPTINPVEFSRCEERGQRTEDGNSTAPVQKTDAATKESIYQAFWKDDVLRAIEYDQIDVHVKNGTVHLSGHIVNAGSQIRILDAIRTVPNILAVNNGLVLDDKLTHEVAASLGTLEHTYDCKFFTGVSHGLVSLNGIVSDENVKLLAEKCAAENPTVRGVINRVRVSGIGVGLPDQPFLQPAIGETIYFLDGVSGAVRQVVMNPNNRRVIAMTLWGRFVGQPQELKSLNNGETRSPERLMVISMDLVRYLTRVSGFLHIRSSERNWHLDFDPASYIAPGVDWTPPYPYCPEDVLFPAENQMANEAHQLPFEEMLEGASVKEPLFANDSLGG